MGCQQAREKSSQNSSNNNNSKVHGSSGQAESQNFKKSSSNINDNQSSAINALAGIENLELIRNSEDLAKVIVKKLIQNNEIKLSTSLRKRTEDFIEEGNYPEAIKAQKKLLSIMRENTETQKQDLVQCLLKIGQLEITMDNHDGAFIYFREILDYDKFPRQRDLHIKSLNQINKSAENMLQKGKLEQALLFKKEVLNFTIFFFGENNEGYKEKIQKLRGEIKQYEEIYKQILMLQSNQELIDAEFFDNQERECMICCKELNIEMIQNNSPLKKTKNQQQQQQFEFNNENEEQEEEKINDNNNSNCNFSTFQDINVTKLRCRHIFHSECINQWFLKKQNCPYCRSELQSQENLDEYLSTTNQSSDRSSQIQNSI